MSNFFKRRTPKIEPEELDRQTAEVEKYFSENRPRMLSVANWLKQREGKNGFGEDFDVTFYPRGV